VGDEGVLVSKANDLTLSNEIVSGRTLFENSFSKFVSKIS
jgi:hypothetical protein